MTQESGKTCPRCGSRDLKHWRELDRDELIVAESREASAAYSPAERLRLMVCTRCGAIVPHRGPLDV